MPLQNADTKRVNAIADTKRANAIADTKTAKAIVDTKRDKLSFRTCHLLRATLRLAKGTVLYPGPEESGHLKRGNAALIYGMTRHMT